MRCAKQIAEVKQMLERLYEKLWRRLGGRPWTEIVREDARHQPLLYLLLFLLAGVFLALKARQNWWQILIGFGAGLIVGHLWW